MTDKPAPHIVIFPGWYPTSNHPYSGDFVQYQADMMQRQGLDLSVMHLDLDYRYGLRGWRHQYKEFRDSYGIMTYQQSGFGWPKYNRGILERWGQSYARLYARNATILTDHHIIHAHNYMGAIGAYYVYQRFGIPYVVTEHSTAFLSRDVPGHHQILLKKALDNASLVIPVSTALANVLGDWTTTTIQVVPNFIDFDLFRIRDKASKPFKIICVGNLIERKRPVLALDAFLDFRQKVNVDAQLHFVGAGDLISDVLQMIAGKGLKDLVILHGQKGMTEVANLIGDAHVLLMTSQFETFGLVLIEALASGVPVISTDSGGPADIVNNDNGILVKEATVNKLSYALNQLFRNCDQYDPHKLRQQAMTMYSASAVVPQLADIYAKVLDKRSL